MQYSILASFVIAIAFATASTAATPTTAPVLPSDFVSAWQQVYSAKCTTPDKVVREFAAYEKGITKRIVRFTKNGVVVVQYFSDMNNDTTVVDIKMTDGSWMRYDRANEKERVAGKDRVVESVGMNAEDLFQCANKQK